MNQQDRLTFDQQAQHYIDALQLSISPALVGRFTHNRRAYQEAINRHILQPAPIGDESINILNSTAADAESDAWEQLIHFLNTQYPDAAHQIDQSQEIYTLIETIIDQDTIHQWLPYFNVHYRYHIKLNSRYVLKPKHEKVESFKRGKTNWNIDVHHTASADDIAAIKEEIKSQIEHAVDPSTVEVKLSLLFRYKSEKERLEAELKLMAQEKEELDNNLFLTLDEIERVDQLLHLNKDTYRQQQIGAITKISASETFVQRNLQQALEILQQAGVPNIKTEGFFKQICLDNIFLHQEVVKEIQKQTFYKKSLHLIVYTIEPTAFEQFEQTRKKRNIFYKSEDHNDLPGLILPDPTDNQFVIKFSHDIALEEMVDQSNVYLRTLQRLFSPEEISTHHKHLISISKNSFLDHIQTIITDDKFDISTNSETIAFDFVDRQELQNSIKQLKSYEELNFNGLKEDHRYKVTFDHNYPLEVIRERINALSYLLTQYDDNMNHLWFFAFQTEEKSVEEMKAEIEAAAGDFGDYNVRMWWNEGY